MGPPDQPQDQQEHQYDQQGVEAPPYEDYVDNNQSAEIVINYNIDEQVNYNVPDMTESQTYSVQDQYARQDQADLDQCPQPQQNPQANPVQYPPSQQKQQQNPVQYPPEQNQQQNPVNYPHQQNQQQNQVQYPPHQNQQQNSVQYPPYQNQQNPVQYSPYQNQQNPVQYQPMIPPPSYACPPPSYSGSGFQMPQVQSSPMQFSQLHIAPKQPSQPTQFWQPTTQGAHLPNPFTPPPQYSAPIAPPNLKSPYEPVEGHPVPNQCHTSVTQVGTQPWRTGLFDCMDDPENAIRTAILPCVTFGQIAEIVDNGQTTCASSGLMYGCIAFLIGCPCILSYTYRTKLRSKYGLMESPAQDWVVHGLFEWCALCQEYRELNKRGLDPSIGWQGNLDKSNMPRPMAMKPPACQTMNY